MLIPHFFFLFKFPKNWVRSHSFGLNMSDRIDLIYSVELYAFRRSEDDSPTLTWWMEVKVCTHKKFEIMWKCSSHTFSFFLKSPKNYVWSHNFGLNMSDRIDLIYSVEPCAFKASEDNSPTLIWQMELKVCTHKKFEIMCKCSSRTFSFFFKSPKNWVRSHNFGLNMSDRIDLIYSVEPYAFRESEDNSPTLIWWM